MQITSEAPIETLELAETSVIQPHKRPRILPKECDIHLTGCAEKRFLATSSIKRRPCAKIIVGPRGGSKGRALARPLRP
jgi:hypothetical protein